MRATVANAIAATPSERLFSDLLPWLVGLTALALVGAVVVYAIRRTITSPPDGGSEGFSLQDLRELHASGELSDEEFDRARDAMIGRVKTRVSGGPSADNQTQPKP